MESLPGDPGPGESGDTAFQHRVLGAIYTLLGVLLLVSVSVSLFAKDEGTIGRAGDFAKTILGFFIGAATGAV